MKKNITKLISAFTATTMLLAGCGSSTENSVVVEREEVVTQGDVESEKSEEPVEFSVVYLMNDWGGEAGDLEILNTMQNESNVKINWLNYSATDWSTQKNLVITGGNLPDAFTGACLLSSDITKYAAEGMLLDLTDLIPKYMPNLSKLLDENPAVKARITDPTDGKIYTLPEVNGRTASRTLGIHYINKTWLDNLGLDIPETTEEYYEVLKAFKEQDANGNGDPNDEIPFSCYANSSNAKEPYAYNQLFGAFGYVDTTKTTTPHYVKTDEGEVIFVPETEGYKEAIQYFHCLVSEGLWDTESFTFTALSQLVAKGGTNPATLGSFVAYEKQFVSSAENLDEYVVLKPLIGPNGNQSRLENTFSCTELGELQENRVQLTVKAKGKEEAILGFYDMGYDIDYAVQLCLGVDGTVITKGEDGKYTYNETPEGVTWSEFRYANAPVWYPFWMTDDDWNNIVPMMEEDVSVNAILAENYDEYLTVSNLFVLPTVEESKIIKSTGQDITDYVNLTQAQWIVDGGIEKEWDAYLKSLKELGLEDYTELVKTMDARMQ